MSPRYWLMKAEPNSRIVKGVDVKFSVDDFKSIGTTPWEGVRNAEARNLMKEMKVQDKVLFYHSNCKAPGIAAFAEVSKEAYPDREHPEGEYHVLFADGGRAYLDTAWDPKHPYFDATTDNVKPKWHMVDVSFVAQTSHFVPLALLRLIAALPTNKPPEDVAYIEEEGVKAIKQMALVNRGRLSVQPVEEKAWGVIEMLAEKGGWDETSLAPNKLRGTKAATAAKKAKPQAATKSRRRKKSAVDEEDAEDVPSETDGAEQRSSHQAGSAGKRKLKDLDESAEAVTNGLRRSTRLKK